MVPVQLLNELSLDILKIVGGDTGRKAFRGAARKIRTPVAAATLLSRYALMATIESEVASGLRLVGGGALATHRRTGQGHGLGGVRVSGVFASISVCDGRDVEMFERRTGTAGAMEMGMTLPGGEGGAASARTRRPTPEGPPPSLLLLLLLMITTYANGSHTVLTVRGRRLGGRSEPIEADTPTTPAFKQRGGGVVDRQPLVPGGDCYSRCEAALGAGHGGVIVVIHQPRRATARGHRGESSSEDWGPLFRKDVMETGKLSNIRFIPAKL
ncbi:hypothetical protein DFH27DRAFT_614500 [Peziza echinospora]|nr:hypothetical protein DFH27DRAFT_614500 [Peziza echinospora]